MNDSLVIIPTYNERENVVRMLETVMGLEFPFDVLVVDDGSPDGTAALVKECQVAHPDRIHLLERKGKLGLGWTATSLTTPRTWCACAFRVPKAAPACRWDRAT